MNGKTNAINIHIEMLFRKKKGKLLTSAICMNLKIPIMNESSQKPDRNKKSMFCMSPYFKNSIKSELMCSDWKQICVFGV